MSILADSSIWIDHLRSGRRDFSQLLEADQILGHPLVLGELACGHLPTRKTFLADYRRLAVAEEASHEEVFTFIEQRKLMGTGLGIVDAHLLCSALVTPGVMLWSFDQRLATAAERLGVALGAR